jgi:hypothetical protein
VLYYSYLTYSYTGMVGLGIAYSFFGVGLVLQQLIISPLARLVFAQERLEVCLPLFTYVAFISGAI